MKHLSLGLLGAAFALSACQTMPPTNPALEEARAAVSAASNDPAVNAAAAPELQRARDALASAEGAWADGNSDDTASRAYIAKQRANIAIEVGSRYSAQQQQDVLFDSGKSQLRAGGRHSLERVADVMKNHRERRVKVEGFTDSQGSESFNVELSQRRADMVKQELETLGVPDDRVETHGYGEAYPVADNDSAAGRQQNRRVELVFSDGNGQFSAAR